LPAEPDSLAAAVAEVSERVSVLVRDEIELAKTEVTRKATSLGRGVVAGLVGVFALIFVLLTIAWAINQATGDLWVGFAVVMIVLIALTVVAFLFAWRKLKVGAPMPDMAIEEAKRIRATVQEEIGT
jgi:uncharacterized membrane protein YcjF (UPF0283 family)